MNPKTQPRSSSAAKGFALTCIALASATLCLRAQVPVKPPADAVATTPAYDIVLIKPDKSGSGSIRIDINDDTFTATNITLKMLLENAYDIKPDLIFGLPGWADSTHFDFTAKMSDPDPSALKKLTDEQREQMLKPVLVDRFKLQAHTEIKTLPVYNLIIGKGGSKLAPLPKTSSAAADPSDDGGMMRVQKSSLSAQAIPVTTLADTLARRLHRTVIDKTGLTGKFNFDLNWTPPEGSDNSPEALDATLFTALQEQLGLKLESSKGAVQTLVVDHVDMPTED